MDLIYTTYIKKSEERNNYGSCDTKCSVSSQNAILFTSSPSLNSSSKHDVCVADLNTPWDIHKVTSFSSEVTALSWNRDGSCFVVADRDGNFQIWQMQDYILTEWKLLTSKAFSKEYFLKAKFFNNGKSVYLNNEKHDTVLYTDKFTVKCRQNQELMMHRNYLTCVLISSTGLVVAVAISDNQNNIGRTKEQNDIQVMSKCLGTIRSRIKHTDAAYMKDGRFLICTSDGHPQGPISTYSIRLVPSSAFNGGLKLDIEIYAALFINGLEEPSSCRAISDLHFINREDCDGLLVGTHHEGGGRVELWELKDSYLSTNKILLSQQGSPGTPSSLSSNKKLTIPVWTFVDSYSGPASQIVALRSPESSLITGKSLTSSTPFCYIAVAYNDGSVQCLLRDSLQRIESVDLPRIGNFCDEPSLKVPRSSVTICDMTFTTTGNALIVIDSLGQLYLYRMSPVSDPGGPHTVPYVVTMLEHCLISGRDWWDLSICCKPSMIEAICEKLTENYNRQPNSSVQQFFFMRYLAIKTSLYRMNPATEFKAADCFAMLMLHSVAGAFKSLLRPTEMSEQISPIDKVSMILQNNQKAEKDIDKLVKGLESIHKEFIVDPQILQSLQQLIQWTASLALHIMASIPEYKHRKGPGFDLANDKKVLSIFRELLLLIRLWGIQRPSCLPVFTRTLDNFDVVAKVFYLITKYKENPNDESILDDCLLLPSQVMIPPLNCLIPPRGVLSLSRIPISFEFGVEPQNLSDGSGLMAGGLSDSVFIEGAMSTNQMIDCVRYMYLGKNPYSVKQCTRCCGITLPQMSIKNTLAKAWDKRWLRNCPCGGYWKMKIVEE